MFEKVNKYHPDKVADRISGALVDIAYANQENPKVAVEVLIGHGACHIIAESSYKFNKREVREVVERIAGPDTKVDFIVVPQDEFLARNQEEEIRCGDNGIFKGTPVTSEQRELCAVAQFLSDEVGTDGKYVLEDGKLTICQSCINSNLLRKMYPDAIVNPLGDWTGGTNVDSGADNRKLGSDMGDGVTGGGVNGKDLSKADVSVNIYCFLKAQELGVPVEAVCSIGDTEVKVIYHDSKKGNKPSTEMVSYKTIVDVAKSYIDYVGGFEKFSEWGLVNNFPLDVGAFL